MTTTYAIIRNALYNITIEKENDIKSCLTEITRWIAWNLIERDPQMFKRRFLERSVIIIEGLTF